jgi:hypothetical protein
MCHTCLNFFFLILCFTLLYSHGKIIDKHLHLRLHCEQVKYLHLSFTYIDTFAKPLHLCQKNKIALLDWFFKMIFCYPTSIIKLMYVSNIISYSLFVLENTPLVANFVRIVATKLVKIGQESPIP